MKKFCKVVFSFEPDIKDDGLKDVLISEFMDVRNGVCKLLNPNYEKWNEEYELLFPNDDSEEGINGLTKNYRIFIVGKQNTVLDLYLNNIYQNDTKMEYYYDLEDADLTGRYKDTEVKLFIELL